MWSTGEFGHTGKSFFYSFGSDGLQSELNHVPFDDGESDYGLIECTAQNSIGQQRDGACKFIFFKKGQHDSAYFGTAHASPLNLVFFPPIYSATQD